MPNVQYTPQAVHNQNDNTVYSSLNSLKKQEYAPILNSSMTVEATATHTPAPPKLLDQLREQIRYLHYSLRTEEAYVYWVKNFIRFHGLQHPRNMGQAAIEAFLSYLATQRKVSVSTHRQALSALLFLYQKVLGIEVPWMDDLAGFVNQYSIACFA